MQSGKFAFPRLQRSIRANLRIVSKRLPSHTPNLEVSAESNRFARASYSVVKELCFRLSVRCHSLALVYFPCIETSRSRRDWPSMAAK